PPVALHDEGRIARERGVALRIPRRPVVRRFRGREIRHVLPGPATLLGVPPDVLLALRPGPPRRVGRGPAVEQPPVRRPGPPPLGCHPALLGGGLAPRHLVHLVRVGAAVDPAAGAGRAVVLELREAAERPAVRPPTA